MKEDTKPCKMRPYHSPAFETLELLRGHSLLAAKELLFAHCQLLIEMHQGYSQSSAANRDQIMVFSLKNRSH